MQGDYMTIVDGDDYVIMCCRRSSEYKVDSFGSEE